MGQNKGKIMAFSAAVLTAAIFLSCESMPKTVAPDSQKKDETLLDLISKGKTDELKKRLSGEESINQQNKQGQTLLHIAALNNDAELVEFLLTLKPDTEIQDKNGDTPFSAAVKEGCYDAAKTLSEADAYIFAKNNDGFSVYDIAAAQGNKALKAAISEKTAEQQNGFGKTWGSSFRRSRSRDRTAAPAADASGAGSCPPCRGTGAGGGTSLKRSRTGTQGLCVF